MVIYEKKKTKDIYKIVCGYSIILLTRMNIRLSVHWTYMG